MLLDGMTYLRQPRGDGGRTTTEDSTTLFVSGEDADKLEDFSLRKARGDAGMIWGKDSKRSPVPPGLDNFVQATSARAQSCRSIVAADVQCTASGHHGLGDRGAVSPWIRRPVVHAGRVVTHHALTASHHVGEIPLQLDFMAFAAE